MPAAAFDRAALVAFAEQSIARGSKSFGAASQLFDRKTRERVWLLYAWCRACDDIADGQDHGERPVAIEGAVSDAEAQERLKMIQRLTEQALTRKPSGEAAFDCLALLLCEVTIPRVYIDAMLQGFERDARGWHPRSEDDLFSYCWNVAGSVGCMMALVMGVDLADQDTLDRACDLGIAFQIANIARDVADDLWVDRCYLPEEWLAEMDIPPGMHLHPAYRPRLTVMAKWLAEYVDDYEASAMLGARKLPFRSRWAVLSAARIYGAIARKVRAASDRAWDHRVSTSSAEKLRFVVEALGRSIVPLPVSEKVQQRAGLWTHPRA